MKRLLNALVITLLLGSVVFLLNAPMIPKARATGPAIVQQCATSGSPATICTFANPTAAGNVVVAAVEVSGSGTNNCATVGTAGWTLQVSSCDHTTSAGNGFGVAIETCVTSCGSSFSLTGTCGGSCLLGGQGYEISGVQLTGLVTAIEGTTNNHCLACNSLSDSVASFTQNVGITIAGQVFWGNGGTSHVLGGSAGLTQYPLSPNNCTTTVTNNGEICSEYILNPAASSTTLPATDTLTGSVAMIGETDAISFDSTSATVTTVVPCNFFQLQCWMYPMFFMGTYLAFFIGLAAAAEVSEKAFLYLMLSGATIGSLIAVDMGIMVAMIPIMLVVLNIVYSFNLAERVVSVVTRRTAGAST